MLYDIFNFDGPDNPGNVSRANMGLEKPPGSLDEQILLNQFKKLIKEDLRIKRSTGLSDNYVSESLFRKLVRYKIIKAYGKKGN